ncbi:OsmC family protein [Streptococcus entericus]|uniref:OsmC family protein n=1 Tax=Streptococcus entericus TaxID=155680 RepID=UPI00036A1336|nr:OsmC family protein [Streptococcus entericus]
MYQTIVKGNRLFQATSTGYGEPITTFGTTEQGETPVSLVVVALASCVTMCVQGYFARRQGKKDLPVEVSASYSETGFDLNVTLAEPITPDLETELEAYIADKCRVKQLLHPDLMVNIRFITDDELALIK